MNYLVDYPPQSLSYDPLKSPIRSDSSKDGMEPLLQNIESEDLHENITENPTKIDIEEEFQDQNLFQGEKTDEDSVPYQPSYGEDFRTPETEETKFSSEPIHTPVEEPQEAYLSQLVLQFQQIQEGHIELLTEIKQRKGIESLEQEIKVFFNFVQERQRYFQNPPEPSQNSPKESDLQAANGEPTSPMKNNGELLNQSRSFETAQNSEENQSEKIENNSPPLDGRQKAEDLLQESPQEELSQDHKTKEISQEKEENKQAENYSLPQDLKFNPSYYIENGPKPEIIVYQNGRQIEQQGFNYERNDHSSKPSTPRFFGLKNIGKTCYMNALFRCLFEVKPFYEEILRIKEYPKFPLIKHFAQLFCKMKNCYEYKDSTQIDLHHRNLVFLIYQTRKEFKPYEEGDSSLLFRAILEGLNDGRDFAQLPHLQIFAGGPLVKGYRCTRCNFFKQTQEPLHILEVKDINFIQKTQENFFQSSQEKRVCRCNNSQNGFKCFYLTTSLPQILTIRITDTVDSKTHVKVLPRIFLPLSDFYGRLQKKVQYGFVSSVMNSFKGKNGSHSIALCCQQGKYRIYDDDKPPQEILFRNIEGHPQLLFYVRSDK